MPQFRYAYNDAEELVDVRQLPEDRSKLDKQYVCVGCGSMLVAKTKNEGREKHFAHKVGQSAACSEETYLHKLGKSAFFKAYKECIESNEPFNIELTHSRICEKYKDLIGHTCIKGELRKLYDLTRYFSDIRMEQRDGSFIPDLVIFDPNDDGQKVYVEIAVTHFLSLEKRTSSNRIIEIPIETEHDVDKIRKKLITEADASFVNFDKRPITVVDAECSCASQPYSYFIVYESGKSFLGNGTLAEISSKRAKLAQSAKYVRLVKSSIEDNGDSSIRGQLFVTLAEEALKRGYPIKNCFLCKYAGENWGFQTEDPIFCKIAKKTCGSNEAVNCTYFRLDHRVANSRRNNYGG